MKLLLILVGTCWCTVDPSSLVKNKGDIVNSFQKQTLDYFYNKDLEKEVQKYLSNVSFCVGDDIQSVVQLLKESFKPEQYKYDQDSPVCNSFETVFPYLCSYQDIQGYMQYNLRSDDPEKIPDTTYCKAGQLNSSCEPGFFNGGVVGGVDKAVRCCPGFFCPLMYTCMIPCPQGAWCPYAYPRPPPPDFLQDNSTWCAPYAYKERKHLGCGGADKWTILPNDPFPRMYSWWWYGSGSIYCNYGWYCPVPTEQHMCQAGHYCKQGSYEMTKCAPLVHCPIDTTVPDSDYLGFTVVLAVFAFFFLCWLAVKGYWWITGGFSSKEKLVIRWDAPDRSLTANVVQRVEAEGYAATEAETDSAREEYLHEEVVAGKSQELSELQLADPLLPPMYHRHPPPPRHRRLRQRRSIGGQELVSLQVNQQEEIQTQSHGHQEQDRPDSPFLTAQLSHELSQRHSRQGSMVQEMTSIGKYNSLTPSRIDLSLDGEEEEMNPFILQQTQQTPSSPQPPHHSVEQLQNNRFNINLKFIGLGYRLKMGKCVLQNVSGKLRSGRITAIMGPSGAGKTTLMSILAGKLQGSGGQQFGVVILNNQPVESLARYRSVMGFVPQDDIMYSDLTVEETLLFSARYRLPATSSDSMRKQYVENAMDVLNIKEIRKQVIGNEERRGISGGQRKRVNVAIELVTNPSLLFLDEPTSGLDSTSSKILVEALKCTAQQGVTVCAVVHQPSYQVFQLFDDVLFLGPGGRTVYYGPQVDVQHYFDSLNFKIPDHMNPSDAYMDIVSGLIMRDGDEDYQVEDLFKLWQLHAGIDMGVVEQMGIQSLDLDVEEHVLHRIDKQQKQFEILGGEQGMVLQIKEIMLVNLYWMFRSVADVWRLSLSAVGRLRHWYYPTEATELYLPLRQTPGVWPQFCWCLQRVVQRRMRHKLVSTLELLVFCITGSMLGYISDRGHGTISKFSEQISYTIVGLALLAIVSSLRTFGVDRQVFFRESGSGLNRFSFFLAMDCADHINTILRSFFYLMIYKSFAEFRAVFWQMMLITLGIVYSCTGVAYILSQIMEPGPAQLSAAVYALINTLMAPHKDLNKRIQKLNFARWAYEGYIIAEANRLKGVWLLARCSDLQMLGIDVRSYTACVLCLFLIGIGARVLACAGLYVLNKSKQK